MAILPEPFSHLTGFQWDAGNSEKNWRTHGVVAGEIEQVFFNLPLIVSPDAAHSRDEPRYFALGRSNAGRMLTIVFTTRDTLVRPIMARDMSRAERRLYATREAAQDGA